MRQMKKVKKRKTKFKKKIKITTNLPPNVSPDPKSHTLYFSLPSHHPLTWQTPANQHPLVPPSTALYLALFKCEKVKP